MTMHKYSLILALLGLGIACSDRPTAPIASPETALSTLIVSPVTLKFKVSGNWKILVDVGDYVKKVAGDSVEYVVSSTGPVRVAGSAVSADGSGGTTYAVDNGLRAFHIAWADTTQGFYSVRATGDYFKLVAATAQAFTFEITTGSQFGQSAWILDNTGNALFARCTTTPVCIF